MAALTDLIMATPAELEAVQGDEMPLRRLPGLDVKGLGLLSLEALDAIVRGFEHAGDDFPAISGEDAEWGPCVFRCPRGFVSALAHLPRRRQREVAKAWADSDVFPFEAWDDEDTERMLREICALARRAVAKHKPVMFWTSTDPAQP
jgi:hypothetical protein